MNVRVAGAIALIVALAAVFLVPSPADRRAANERAALSAQAASLGEDLAAERSRLDATQAALEQAETERAAAEAELHRLVEELQSAGLAQYNAIVAAFADAAAVACAGYEADATVGEDAGELARRAAECNANELSIIAGELAAQPRVCGVVPLTAAGTEDLDECVLLYAHSSDVLVDSLAVTDWAGEGLVDVLRASVPVSAGDTLDVSGYFRVTNELPANVGVAGHLWAVDIDSEAPRAWRIGPSTGDNVDRARHHMPITLDTVYTVPRDWPEGDRMLIVMKADAHSTATNGEIDVDANGNLIIRITRA